ncbi:hypothetical protein GGF46_000269 [Coemansia sp. RSA 552]|nr:hypothetical protein GGF46_000269 [Coemansia sp. RSA 552]
MNRGAGGMATLGMPSAEPDDSDSNQRSFSRPASTSSGTSEVSMVGGPDTASAAAAAAAASAKLAESLGSFSTMPTPRNTFLTPPAGINLAEKGPHQSGPANSKSQLPTPAWESAQHKEQLQTLLEQQATRSAVEEGPAAADGKPTAQPPVLPRLASYDDSYCLLNGPPSASCGPRTRRDAIVLLRRLAGASDCAGSSGQSHPQTADIPLALAPPVDALTQLEDSLMGIVTRRQIPNRTQAHYLPAKGGAGSSLATADATTDGSVAGPGKFSYRKQQRQSAMSADSVGSGADDQRSMRSRASVISSEIIASLVPGATPYVDLNAHIERLTVCISRLQRAAPPDGSTSRPVSSRKADTIANQPPPMPPLPTLSHYRKNSLMGTSAASAASSQPPAAARHAADGSQRDDPDARQPPNACLSPVSESPVFGARIEPTDTVRSRSSSHLSILSGTSTESRRRIVTSEVPTSSQFPNLFGAPVADAAGSARGPSRQSPIGPAQSIHSTPSESIYSQESSDGRSHIMSMMPPREPTPGSESPGSSLSAPVVCVRDITPASRLALWLHIHTTTGTHRTTLWRRKQWHRRFVIFTGNALYLFKSSAPAATALLVIRLSTNTIVCVNDSFHNRDWVVEITHPPSTDNPTALPQSSSASFSLVPQSWYLQTDMRSEMITLLKQLKAAIGELQVRPDLERREEERMRDRRRRQRKEARSKTDVCPWEVDEFSEGESGSVVSDAGAADSSRGSDNLQAFGRIPDEELFSSDDDTVSRPPIRSRKGSRDDSADLDKYSLGSSGNDVGARRSRPARLDIGDYTGTGGIAEWGAHRLQVPYSPVSSSTGMHPSKVRSFSADPSAATGRRPSLADVLAPPSSAVQELTPIPNYSAHTTPRTSPQTPPQTVGSRRAVTNINPAVRNSTMIKSAANDLIDQMFASASRELEVPEDSAADGPPAEAPGKMKLLAVLEED